MADDLPPGYRPCVRCGRGTLFRMMLSNPDTGERERVPLCLGGCALQARISGAFAASAGPDGKPDGWRRLVFGDGPGVG